MENARIKEAFKKYKNSDFYKTLGPYRKLSDGKSAEVFANDVIRRVKMEYMGLVNNKGDYSIYNFNSTRNGLVSSTGGNVRDLVTSYGILQATTRLYAEYGTSKPLLINSTKEIEEIDFDDLLARLMVIQSWAGRVLIKGVVEDTNFSFYPVTPADYFSVKNIYNPHITDSYIIYSVVDDENEKTLLCEVYEDGSIEYKAFSLNEDNDIKQEVKYPLDLGINGMTENGLGYKDPGATGWAVVEIQNIFGTSDYNDDIVRAVREIVIGDTLTSQAFQKVANPLLQVPESIIEVDTSGKATVRIDGRIITLRPDDREVKQVQLETKTLEWKEHKKDIKDSIYIQLGVNDLAFGISIDGAVASGEAKIRSLERVLSTVISKRDKCIAGMEKLVKWTFKRVHDEEIDIVITGQDILNLSLAEKINIVVNGVTNGVMSLETAVKFLGIAETEEEIEQIKKELNYKSKTLQLLQQLEAISRDERLQQEAENITEELIKELIG